MLKNFEVIYHSMSELIIGREKELILLTKAALQGIPIIIEGPVGTGKTEMAKTLALSLGSPFTRVDGDDNLTAMKLKGWYDPPLVLQKGFSIDSFIPGPLTDAMMNGGLFFFNETNRAPSETINAVLTALDEKLVTIPQLGTITAQEGFLPIFTFNPEETVATNPLPKAFYDRCIWIYVTHQSLAEMIKIVEIRTSSKDDLLNTISCEIVQATLLHPELEHGSSVRGAIQFVKMLSQNQDLDEQHIIELASAIHSRKIRVKTTSAKNEKNIIREIVLKILSTYDDPRIIRKKG